MADSFLVRIDLKRLRENFATAGSEMTQDHELGRQPFVDIAVSSLLVADFVGGGQSGQGL